MSCEEIRDRLDAYLDEELDEGLRGRVAAHLQACEDCRADFDWLRELRRRAAALPREIEPERDLWPGIEERVGRREVVSAPFGEARSSAPRDAARSAGWRHWGLLAAAALLLVTVSSGITAWWMTAGDPPGPGPGPAGVVLAEMRSVELEYQRITDDLLAALERRRDRLDPETVRVVEENLTIIDDAIDEMRAALERDPANADLAGQLTTAYRKRIELLQKANRITL